MIIGPIEHGAIVGMKCELLDSLKGNKGFPGRSGWLLRIICDHGESLRLTKYPCGRSIVCIYTYGFGLHYQGA